jgi:nucleoside-diphosphate-sugar epimerase
MSPTLITGAPGWIGTRLVRALLEGIPDLPGLSKPDDQRQVRALVLPGLDYSALHQSKRAEIVQGDVRCPEDLKAFCRGAEGEVIFHCAGIVHPKLFVRDFYEVNVKGTQNLLRAAQEAGVRRVVVLSSNSPIGNNPHRDHRFDETSPYNPYMNYGRSKMRMELAVREFQARGQIETVILRPTWFYGPDQPQRQTSFFRMIKNGGAPILGDGENMRSMVYVDNLCQAVLLCEHNPLANGQTYWVADRRPYSMNEIIDTVERLMEQEFGLAVAHKRLRLPVIAGDFAHFCDSLIQGIGLYQQEVHVLSEMKHTIACSIEKAQRELGYAPMIELEEGMRRSLSWCMKKGIPL